MNKLRDDSLMPFGIHKGKAMVNVPASYLLYIYKNTYNNTLQKNSDVSHYIYDNLEDLKKEANEKR